MANIKKRDDGWSVRWKELLVTRDETGTERREWKDRRRTFPLERDARQFARDIETAAARGERFVDRREKAVSTLRAVCLAYVAAARDANAPIATQRYRSSMVGAFLAWAGEEALASDLSLDLLEEYANSLDATGRKAVTRHRKVLAVEQLWRWAHDRPERFPGVPAPRRVTGAGTEADKLRAPDPVVAMAAPTWAEVDAMIEELTRPGGARRRTAAPAPGEKKPRGGNRPPPPWHRRIAILMRYTGLRASQACGLDWRDVDLDRGVLRARAKVRGAKTGRTRVIPLHPALVAEMAGWGVREGLVFPRWYQKGGQPMPGPYRGDALVEPFRGAWERAKVSPEKWAAPDSDLEGAREKASPTHAIRRCIRTELLRAGVEEAIVLYLVGHSQGVTAAAYVPEDSPEESPYWPRLVDAVGRIPDHRAQSVARLTNSGERSRM